MAWEKESGTIEAGKKAQEREEVNRILKDSGHEQYEQVAQQISDMKPEEKMRYARQYGLQHTKIEGISTASHSAEGQKATLAENAQISDAGRKLAHARKHGI